MIRIVWGSIQEHLKVRLRVSITIVSIFDNTDHVIPKFVLYIRSIGAVESNKVVRTGSCLNLGSNRLVSPEVIIYDANSMTCPGAFIDRFVCNLCIIVPSINLKFLGVIESHHTNII